MHPSPYLVSVSLYFLLQVLLKYPSFPWLGLREYIAITDKVLLIYAIKHVINICNYTVRGVSEMGSMLISCLSTTYTKTGLYAWHLLPL